MLKCLIRLVRSDALSILSPLQLGVNVRGGCEAIIHSITSMLLHIRAGPFYLIFLKLSSHVPRNLFSIAFYICVDGVILLLPAYTASGPGHHPKLLWCLAGGSSWTYRFCTYPPPNRRAYKAQVPTLALNAWYLEDSTLIGGPEQLAAALDIIKQDGPAVQIPPLIPENKNHLIPPLPPEISVSHQGFSYLGCPIGPPAYCM